MESLVTDARLAFEVRELYIIARNWASNLSFNERETAALKKQLTRLVGAGIPDDQRDHAQALLFKINRITFGIAKLEESLPAHLKMLEYLMSGAGNYYTLDLIENHARLEQRIDAIFDLFLEVSTGVHRLSEPEAAPYRPGF